MSRGREGGVIRRDEGGAQRFDVPVAAAGSAFRRSAQARPEWDAHRDAEKVIAASGAKVQHVAGDRAYYRIAEDQVVLPEPSQFPTRYTEKSWDVPDSSEVEGLTERVGPFVSSTKEAFEAWGQAWSYMVYLRHYGFPSPFLDWTRSPYVAAFFAFRRPIMGVKKVSIYAYCEMPNPRDCPKGSSSNRPEIIIVPKQHVRTHRRHFLQQCEYTICVRNRESEWLFVPHEEVFQRGDLNHDVLWKFSLPATERLKALKLLDRSNINAFSLFQSEESLMETMAFRELDCHRL